MTDKKNDKKSEESVPVEEVKIPKMLSVAHFIKSVLVLLISFVCILIGIAIYQVYSPLDKFHLVQPEPKKQVEVKTPSILTVQNETHPEMESSTARQMVINDPPFVPTSVPIFEDDSKPQQDVLIEEALPKTDETEVKNMLSEPKNELALSDVLKLRDELATGKNCLETFQKIMKHQLEPSLKDRLMLELMPVCTNRSLYPEIKTTFKKDKKAAFYTYYRLRNPKWMAYVKSFLTTLVDVRRLNPKQAKPKDLIYQAQNALMVNDLEKSLAAIRKLPTEIQSDFDVYIKSVSLYLAAQKLADQLLFQFDRKGE